MLHKVDCFFRKEGRRVVVLCVLDLRAVGGILPRSLRRVGGALALDVGILAGLFGDIWAWRCHRRVWCSPS